jgi:tRNA pseudouridine55 synthase
LKPRWEGLLLVDKPTGPTSHDVVGAVRRATGQRRVGHAGTLDPLASGLLPLVLGRATRLVRFLPGSPKRYEGTLRLGLTTRSDDVTGEVLSRYAGTLPASAEVIAAAATLRGTLLQQPPAISARKVGGQRMYRLARQGVEVRGAPVEVEVARFDLEPTESPQVYRFAARVSAGTYIRALARDLGAALGCGGVLETLRRTAIAEMTPDPRLALEEGVTPPSERLHEALIPLERMPLLPPRVRLEAAERATGFLNGGSVPAPPGTPDGELIAVLSVDGNLLGVAERRGGELHPRVVLPPAAG